MTRRQKKYLLKWFLIAGLICLVINSAGLLLIHRIPMSHPLFWVEGLSVFGGGGVIFGIYPAALLEFRREEKRSEESEK